MNSSLFVRETKNEAFCSRLLKFNERSRALLSFGNPKFSGRIPASAVEALAKSENGSVDDQMLGLLPLAQTYSRAPISSFFVGVVARGASGSLYLGANIEISRQCLGPGQVVLKMKAFSINYRELLVVNGVGRWRPPLGRVPVSDGVGLVVAAGTGVSRVKIGDRVSPIFYPKWLEGRVTAEKMEHALGGAAADGVLAEYTVFDDTSLIRVPAHLTDEEAATLPCAGVTAWNALLSFGNIMPGDSVVVLGTGGVSVFALQFAQFRGARVIITSSSDQKLARAKELGADAGIDYKVRPDWPTAIAELTDGAGADYIVDTVGELKKAIAAVRLGGTVAFVGLLHGMTTEVDLVTFMGKCSRVEAVDVGSREMFEAMNKAIAFHAMRPVVDRVFGFFELREALNCLRGARHFGKICLRP